MKNKILHLTRKHPVWQKLFLFWLDYPYNDLNFNLLEAGFSKYLKYEHLLSHHLPITHFQSEDFLDKKYKKIIIKTEKKHKRSHIYKLIFSFIFGDKQ